MQYEWALARYTSNDERGKKVVELANYGVGYHIINKERSKGEDVIVAFKFIPIDKNGNSRPLPAHLELASKHQSVKLDEWDKKRNGVPDSGVRRGIVTPAKIAEIKRMMS
jgi:hypothetical protein